MIRRKNKETIKSTECEHNFDGGRPMRASSAGKKGSLRQGLDARVSLAGQGAGHPGGGPHTECPPHWVQDRKYPGTRHPF